MKVPLTRGLFALIDDADAERVMALNWKARPAVSTGGGQCGFYACRTLRAPGKPATTLYLHRFILEAAKGQAVDHINGDKLDNRRANLRFCSPSENVSNRRYSSASGYRGVVRVKSGRWEARATIEGRLRRMGRFDTREDAARAYDTVARKVFGDFAILNFPENQA